jgi:hypothetical protein
LERQRTQDRSQTDQEIVILREAIQTSDTTNRTAVNSLLKNASRVCLHSLLP